MCVCVCVCVLVMCVMRNRCVCVLCQHVPLCAIDSAGGQGLGPEQS